MSWLGCSRGGLVGWVVGVFCLGIFHLGRERSLFVEKGCLIVLLFWRTTFEFFVCFCSRKNSFRCFFFLFCVFWN